MGASSVGRLVVRGDFTFLDGNLLGVVTLERGRGRVFSVCGSGTLNPVRTAFPFPFPIPIPVFGRGDEKEATATIPAAVGA